MFWMAVAYCTLLVYGTLFPLDEWTPPIFGWSNPITLPWPAQASRADIMVNVLAYIPMGLFLVLWLRSKLGIVLAVLLASLFGCGLSFALEILQSALPSRVPSRLDWATNTAGALTGALSGALFDPRLPSSRALLELRRSWFAPGALVNLALSILGLWAMTQAAPFIPSLDWGNLKTGLKPLGNTLRHLETFQPLLALETGLTILALGLLARMAALRSTVWPFLFFTLGVLLLKVPVVGRQLTLEAMAGWAGAMAVLLVWPTKSMPARVLGMGAALVSAYALSQFRPGDTASTYAINWIPFKDQVGTLAGMSDILETLWPFMALALAVRWLTPWRWRRAVWLGGGLAVAALTFALEWMQQSIPGRFADITDVLLAVAGWMLPWLLTDTRGRMAEPVAPARAVRWALPALAVTVASLGFVGWTVGSTVRVETDERGRAMLPAPENLAPIALPGFHRSHPRLPHPSRADIERLHVENPEWFNQLRGRARNGEGDLYAITLLALIEPGSQDLARLHQRLMAEQYSYRGEQAKPVALAYDWLYDQWSDAQRAQLRDKLAEGVAFLVELIRRDRLSPYNVYLYNSPFQALIAANLALYDDDPRGELNMRFTYDLWKHRVLPAWRQVMGQNGGWHEGGEYVGVGIGQAIYQVPAMWRAATGEDLFKTEPGIRGFLDFMVYRKQPDGTDFRWGDAGYFDRIVPDLIPLALEYRHAAAYSLSPPRETVPTGWPWGPLSDASMVDPLARERLPLARRFDGIGMVVARSDWSPDATYVTFKAGDNFWSHSHLDQGAFTLYKGGGLALDSGLYGPKYGSDHHMNYTYQSIAHNLVTVTDPADTAVSEGKTVREIANDGGQRRIGSGWGLASAPIDVTDWEDQRALYHTGSLVGYRADADSVVAVADVTPAYTNSQSGAGEFSHRTRRVEKLWRTFIYDRAADVVIVRDLVRSTHAEFQKRWLLHTTDRPSIGGNRFHVDLPPNLARGQAGGQLDGYVLLPEQARLNAIGGPGFEFWVDGKNYDENGMLAAVIASRRQPVEPGNWRIEISPPAPRTDDEFLVVLVPRLATAVTAPQIRKIERNGLRGVEIVGTGGTRRWWFTPDRMDVSLETASGSRKIYVQPADYLEDDSLSQRLVRWWRALLD